MMAVDPTDFAFENDGADFVDRKDFRSYRAAIEGVVHAAGEPIGTRQIHEALGAAIRQEWTLDALESLRSVRRVPGFIDRWERDPSSPLKMAHTTAEERKNPSWMFSGPEKDQREAEFAAKEKEPPRTQGRLFDRKAIKQTVTRQIEEQKAARVTGVERCKYRKDRRAENREKAAAYLARSHKQDPALEAV